VVGPGLGREDSVFNTIDISLKKLVQDKNTTFVGDADFLWFLSDSKNKLLLAQ
jgi:NAD(P)H-hydrate repair Nnr-like enzyme with NAD(P)H-hydrate dehydratase domain